MKSAMLRSILKNSSSSSLLRRGYSSECAPERKVAVLGAAGGIGQPLALVMKLNPLVSALSLYDITGIPGVAADVSHVNTRSEVVGYTAIAKYFPSCTCEFDQQPCELHCANCF